MLAQVSPRELASRRGPIGQIAIVVRNPQIGKQALHEAAGFERLSIWVVEDRECESMAFGPANWLAPEPVVLRNRSR